MKIEAKYLVPGLLILSFFLVSKLCNSQNITITDDNSYTPDESAMLDVKSTDKGLLVPRMSSTERNAISSPATGLLVFDTDENAFFYYAGTNGWLNLTTKVIKPASATVDSVLFCVVNGMDTIFAVYPEGVRFQVGNGDAKGAKGGFAVGGLTSGGKSTEEYLQVFRDSVRIYVDPATKGAKGGFAVGGLNSKGDADFLKITKDNYFIGHESGINNLTGIYNVFLGYQSGKTNQYGRENVFLGYNAGFSNFGNESNQFQGAYNTFIGTNSGYTNSTGSYNVFFGYLSGRDNDTGVRNVFIGSQSGSWNESGDDNVYIGNNAGQRNTTGLNNVAIGANAGFYNTGSENVMIGRYSGYNNTGSGNVFIGQRAGFNAETSNTLFIDNSSADNTNALIYGQFSNDSLWLNADVQVKKALEVGEAISVGHTDTEKTGAIRLNSSTSVFEGYDGSQWQAFHASKQTHTTKVYKQTEEPDIPANTSAFWIDDRGNYYLILDYEGIQKKLLMND